MAASPADAPFGGLILTEEARPGPASHDGAGRRFVFCPPAADAGHLYALDVELRALPVPPHLGRALGPQAMRHWGRIEVMAKLLDIPAHLMLRRHLAGEAAALIRAHGLTFCRADTATHWRIVGRRPSDGARR